MVWLASAMPDALISVLNGQPPGLNLAPVAVYVTLTFPFTKHLDGESDEVLKSHQLNYQTALIHRNTPTPSSWHQQAAVLEVTNFSLKSLFSPLPSPFRASSTFWSTHRNCPPGWRTPPSRRRCSPTPSGTTLSATRRSLAWRSMRTMCTACRGWRGPAFVTSTWSGSSTAPGRWRRCESLTAEQMSAGQKK